MAQRSFLLLDFNIYPSPRRDERENEKERKREGLDWQSQGTKKLDFKSPAASHRLQWLCLFRAAIVSIIGLEESPVLLSGVTPQERRTHRHSAYFHNALGIPDPIVCATRSCLLLSLRFLFAFDCVNVDDLCLLTHYVVFVRIVLFFILLRSCNIRSSVTSRMTKEKIRSLVNIQFLTFNLYVNLKIWWWSYSLSLCMYHIHKHIKSNKLLTILQYRSFDIAADKKFCFMVTAYALFLLGK